MGALGDKFKKLAGDQTRQLLQNFQNAQSSKTRNGYSYGKLNEDGTATLADGTTVQVEVKGRPGQYTPVFNLGNGQGLVDQPEAKFFTVDGGSEKYYLLLVDIASNYSYDAGGSSPSTRTRVSGYTAINLIDIKQEVTYSIPSMYFPTNSFNLAQVTATNENSLVDFSLDTKHILIVSYAYAAISANYELSTALNYRTQSDIYIQYSILKNWYIEAGEVKSDEVIHGSIDNLSAYIGQPTLFLPYYCSNILSIAILERTGPTPRDNQYGTSNSLTLVPVLYDIIDSNGEPTLNFDMYYRERSLVDCSAYSFTYLGDLDVFNLSFYDDVRTGYLSNILGTPVFTSLYRSLDVFPLLYTQISQGNIGYPNYMRVDTPNADVTGPILWGCQLYGNKLQRSWAHFRTRNSYDANITSVIANYIPEDDIVVTSQVDTGVHKDYYFVADTATEEDGNFFTSPELNDVTQDLSGSYTQYPYFSIDEVTTNAIPEVSYDKFAIGFASGSVLSGSSYSKFLADTPTPYLGQYTPNEIPVESRFMLRSPSVGFANSEFEYPYISFRNTGNTGSVGVGLFTAYISSIFLNAGQVEDPGIYYGLLSTSKLMFQGVRGTSKKIALGYYNQRQANGVDFIYKISLLEFTTDTQSEVETFPLSRSWDLSEYFYRVGVGPFVTSNALQAIGYR